MNNYISIKQLMDELLRHPLLLDLTLEAAVSYALEYIRIVGMPLVYTEKSVRLPLVEYRCMLPCDFVEIILVTDDKNNSYRYTTDTFHTVREEKEKTELTYKIQNNFLYSNRKEGTVDISYRAIDTDEDGYPLLVDNSSFIKGLKAYIRQEWFGILYDLGKIQLGPLQRALQEYCWYVGQAQTDLIRPTLDLMQSFTNMWNRLLVKTLDHYNQYEHTGDKLYLKLH